MSAPRSMWHQFLDAQAEIQGNPTEPPHDCETMEHVFEDGTCLVCGEAEFDDPPPPREEPAGEAGEAGL